MTGTAGAERRLTGTLTVARPPSEAFGLFTPRGEQAWAPGWLPRFPVERADDSHPGTVFETDGQSGTVTWIVLDRDWGRRVRYARVTPRTTAGTVTVTLDPVGASSRVTVTYELTALSEAGRSELAAFADDFVAFLRSWEKAIGSPERGI
jgi:hypothetical protein